MKNNELLSQQTPLAACLIHAFQFGGLIFGEKVHVLYVRKYIIYICMQIHMLFCPYHQPQPSLSPYILSQSHQIAHLYTYLSCTHIHISLCKSTTMTLYSSISTNGYPHVPTPPPPLCPYACNYAFHPFILHFPVHINPALPTCIY